MSARGAETVPLPRRPPRLGRRGVVLLGLMGFGAWSWWGLELRLADLVPREGWAAASRRFFGAALQPALDYEAVDTPAGAPPFLVVLLHALRRTIVFAAAASSLALIGGTILGFLASSTWWAQDRASASAAGSRGPRRAFGPLVQAGCRVLIALLRSVHELIWAVVMLAAIGLNTGAAVLALAIPYTGTLAKIFSEMLDEAPRDAAAGVRSCGASPWQVFLFGHLPRAMPDLVGYAFYRFECAIRSSAVLGFFGYQTIGYQLARSFENQHYREVWSYLYALIGMVLLLEAWSGMIRKRMTS